MWAVVAPTFRDVRVTCFEGPSGIRRQLEPGEEDQWRRNELRLDLVNGSVIYGYSADQPERLRGSNLSGAWCDEMGSWQYEETWYEGLVPALRIGEHPRVLVTTTPRPTKLVRDLHSRRDGTVHVTTASTWENAKNLSATALDELRRRYEGTRLGRQELEGELLEDMEGALWKRSDIDAARIRLADVPDLVRVVVGVDPAVTSGEDSDETGIVVAGDDGHGHGYILGDYSMKGTPEACMREAVRAYKRHGADCIVAEVNNGGDFVGTVLRTVDPDVPYHTVRASRGKATRAEPVSSLAEQHRLHHVGSFPALEDQMCALTPGISPGPDDRVDACIAAGTLVSLQRGDVPIENVVPGDMAWTRNGWRKVTAAWCSRRDAEVLTVELSDGRKLTGTPDHRILVGGKGWLRLDALVCGDTLSAWTRQRNHPPKLSFKESSTVAIRTASSEHTGSTISGLADGTAFTGMSGSGQTSRRSRRAGTSTTRMRIRSTTNRKISSPSRQLNTSASIQEQTGLRWKSISNESGRWLLNGIVLKQATSGTWSTASEPGMAGSLGSFESVKNAESLSWRGSSGRRTAHASASTEHAKRSISKKSHARFAVPYLNGISTANDLTLAHVSVVRSYVSSSRQDVYDLTVEREHEFTANGVIVHNCVWAVFELRGLSQASWLSAYGAQRCAACDHAYSSGLKGCPRCGADNPAEAARQARADGDGDGEVEQGPEEEYTAGGWASVYNLKRCPRGHAYSAKSKQCPRCQGGVSFLRQNGKRVDTRTALG